MAAKALALLDYKALKKTSLSYAAQEVKALTWDKTAQKIIEVYKQAKEG